MQNKSVNRRIENLKRNQNQILELKNTTNEMKISLDRFKGRFEQAKEEKIMEIIEAEEQKV